MGRLFQPHQERQIQSGLTLHARLASGGGQAEVLLENNPADPMTLTWPEISADGHYLVYQQQNGLPVTPPEPRPARPES